MKGRLLIVDDEKDIREMLSDHFGFLGYEVDLAANGKDALEKMSTNKYEIVISDIIMPEMDGIDLLRNIKQQYPMTHVIMITGYVTLDNALACMRHGADTCIFKPLQDLKELEKAIKSALSSLETWHQKLKQLKGMKNDRLE
ncbi:MAG: response regulator [Fibrobacterota bacterium]